MAAQFYGHMLMLVISLFLILIGLYAVREIIRMLIWMNARRRFRLALSRALGVKL